MQLGLPKTILYTPVRPRTGWAMILILCLGFLLFGSFKAVSQRNELRDLETRAQQEGQLLAFEITIGQQVEALKEEVAVLGAKAREDAVLFPQDGEVPGLLSWLNYWLTNNDATSANLRHNKLEQLDYYACTQITLEYTTSFDRALAIANDLFALFPSIRIQSGHLWVEDDPTKVSTRLIVYLYSVRHKEENWRFPTELPQDLAVSNIFTVDAQLAAKLSLGKAEERLDTEEIWLRGVIIDEDTRYALIDVDGKTQLVVEGQEFSGLVVQAIDLDYVALGLSPTSPFVFIRGR